MFSGLAGWHVLIVGVFLIPFILWVIAVVQIATSRAAAGPTVGWLILVTLAPLLGAILWFAIGRGSLRQQTPPTQAG